MSAIPFERSFASHERSSYWSSKNGEITPRDVFKSSHNYQGKHIISGISMLN